MGRHKRVFGLGVCVATLMGGAVVPRGAVGAAPRQASNEAAPAAAVLSSTNPWMETILGQQHTINETISSRYIDKTRSGDRIRVSMYLAASTFNSKTGTYLRSQLLNSLTAAAQRGVSVEFISEYRNLTKSSTANRAKAYKKALEDAGVKVTYCVEGCMTDRRSKDPSDPKAINHHKFFLFEFRHPTSGIPSGGRVVVQSSANDHYRGIYDQAFAFDGKAYDNVWAQYDRAFNIASRFHSPTTVWKYGDKSWKGSHPSRYRGVTAFIGPFRNGADEQVRALESALSKTKASHNKPGCVVDVAMGHWSDSHRGRLIRNRLISLAKAGCKVRIAAKPSSAIAKSLRAADKKYKNFTYKYSGCVHAKYITLGFPQKKGGKLVYRELVYAGSMNFMKGDLYFDDNAIVRIDRKEVYDQFRAYTTKLLSLPKTTGYCQWS